MPETIIVAKVMGYHLVRRTSASGPDSPLAASGVSWQNMPQTADTMCSNAVHIKWAIVWTTPLLQEESDAVLRSGASHVSGLFVAVHMTAGLDVLPQTGSQSKKHGL